MKIAKTLYLFFFCFVIGQTPVITSAEANNTSGGKTPFAIYWGKSGAFAELESRRISGVRSVVDGDTIVLNSGPEVRFVGIQAPKLPLGRKNFPTWPLAQEAADFITALTVNRRFTTHVGQTAQDRHQRLLAHLVRDDGLWLQGTLLRAGLARVYSFPDNTRLVSEMLAIEEKARRERRGIWALPHYRIRDAARANWPDGSGFELVQGTVAKVARVRGTTYLNFGENWKTDFTITIPARWRRNFTSAGIDLASYAGRKLLVRGWVKRRNGWMIIATHPEQLQER